MKKNRIIIIISFLVIVYGMQSCDPPLVPCTDPKCAYSPVGTEIQGILSGNLDSVIHIGDTIRFYMKIPDTMVTNYGNIAFGHLLENSFFGINCTAFDSLTANGSINATQITKVIVKSGTMVNGDKTWDYSTREFECLFIPNRVGKCLLTITDGRLEMTANDGRSWFINPYTIFNCPRRYDQYLSWVDSSMRDEAYNVITQKKGWYWFEVK
jgi:hypothetical protein